MVDCLFKIVLTCRDNSLRFLIWFVHSDIRECASTNFTEPKSKISNKLYEYTYMYNLYIYTYTNHSYTHIHTRTYDDLFSI